MLCSLHAEAQTHILASPDKRLQVTFRLTENGEPRYSVALDRTTVLRESKLGPVRDDADFARDLRLVAARPTETVRDEYELATPKRRRNHYVANRGVFVLQTPQGAVLDKEIPVGTPPHTGAGWVYPALFRIGDIRLLVSETGLTRNYCGTRLLSRWRSSEYAIGFPDLLEHFNDGPVAPQGGAAVDHAVANRRDRRSEDHRRIDSRDGPGHEAATVEHRAVGRPGHGVVELAATRRRPDHLRNPAPLHRLRGRNGLSYALVDGLWDTQIGYEKLRELVDYARAKRVRILVWYNSAGDWNSTPQTPRDLMLTHASRMREFARLKDIGVAGLKVDFFGGDGHSVMEYYQDILEDAWSRGAGPGVSGVCTRGRSTAD